MPPASKPADGDLSALTRPDNDVSATAQSGACPLCEVTAALGPLGLCAVCGAFPVLAAAFAEGLVRRAGGAVELLPRVPPVVTV